jgi:hypothetical protein
MILLHAIVAALYAIAAWARWPRETAIPATAARAAVWLLPAALVLHAIVIAHVIFSPDGLDLSLAHAISLVAGLSVLIAWTSGVLATLPPRRRRHCCDRSARRAVAGAMVRSTPLRLHGGKRVTAHVPSRSSLCAVHRCGSVALSNGPRNRLHRGLSATGNDTPPLLTLERYSSA